MAKEPNFNEEKACWKNGFNFVVGLDEAGRGPLAGPVVAGAICMNKNAKICIRGINDSKKLSEKQREKLFIALTNHKDIRWGVGIVSEKVIDKINILEATKKAMLLAVKKINADFLLIDGNILLLCDTKQKAIIKGDQKVFSIAAASIIAKVTRDRIMQKMHKKYPAYGFDKHKGYGTRAHFAALKKYGSLKCHRQSFCFGNKITNNYPFNF